MPPTSGDPQSLCELAVQIAEDTGELLTAFAQRLARGDDLDVSAKSTPTDLVSEADRAAERSIAEQLLAARPDDGLLAEENQAPRTGSSGLRWVVDPLDGTINFLHGLDAWAVSIAVEDEHGTVAGVVHHPSTGESFQAARGHGARVGDRKLTVSRTDGLDDVLLATGFSYDPVVRTDQGRDLAALLPMVRDVRRGGAAALDLAWCAAGRLDGYLEFGLQPWDWAAGRLLVVEAGGRATTVARELGGRIRSGLVAGGPAAHGALAAWLEDNPRPIEGPAPAPAGD